MAQSHGVYKEVNIVKHIIFGRLQWAGHAVEMPERISISMIVTGLASGHVDVVHVIDGLAILL